MKKNIFCGIMIVSILISINFSMNFNSKVSKLIILLSDIEADASTDEEATIICNRPQKGWGRCFIGYNTGPWVGNHYCKFTGSQSDYCPEPFID